MIGCPFTNARKTPPPVTCQRADATSFSLTYVFTFTVVSGSSGFRGAFTVMNLALFQSTSLPSSAQSGMIESATSAFTPGLKCSTAGGSA